MMELQQLLEREQVEPEALLVWARARADALLTTIDPDSELARLLEPGGSMSAALPAGDGGPPQGAAVPEDAAPPVHQDELLPPEEAPAWEEPALGDLPAQEAGGVLLGDEEMPAQEGDVLLGDEEMPAQEEDVLLGDDEAEMPVREEHAMLPADGDGGDSSLESEETVVRPSADVLPDGAEDIEEIDDVELIEDDDLELIEDD